METNKVVVNKIVNDFMKAIDGEVNKGSYDIENLGEEAFQNNNNSVKCSSCGRSFTYDRLKNHQKICFKHPELFKKK